MGKITLPWLVIANLLVAASPFHNSIRVHGIINFVVLCLIVLVDTSSCYAFKGINLSPKCSEKCTAKNTVRCRTSVPDYELGVSDYLSPQAQSGNSPGAPRDLNVTQTHLNNGKIQLTVTWKLPYDASYKKTTGFYLKITSMTSGEIGIYIDVNQSDLLAFSVPEILDVVFQYDCLEFDQEPQHITLYLYSLPLPVMGHLMGNFLVRFYTISPNHKHMIDSGSWMTNISNISISMTKNTSQNCGYSAQFSFFVMKDSFLSFNYQLIRILPDRGKIGISKNTTMYYTNPEIIFKSLCSGSYEIQLWPVRENLKRECVCGIMGTLTGPGRECQHCVRQRFPLNLPPVNNAQTSSIIEDTQQSKKSNSVPRLIYCVVAVLFVTVSTVLALVLVLYCKKFMTAGNRTQGEASQSPAGNGTRSEASQCLSSPMSSSNYSGSGSLLSDSEMTAFYSPRRSQDFVSNLSITLTTFNGESPEQFEIEKSHFPLNTHEYEM